MARDAFEYDVGGELRDRYGRPEYVLVPKHNTPLASDVSRAYQPADGDGRVQMVLQDLLGNDVAGGLLLPGSVGADPLGRTQVIGSSTIPAPAILSIISIMDAPWGAKCDAKVVTDGVIAGGALNQVGSAAAGFTPLDVGKSVVVQAVGANVNPGGVRPLTPSALSTTISSVSGGVATLAAPATFAGTGLTVKYGTDDTVAIQAAITAASAQAAATKSGVVVVQSPSGRSCMVGALMPKNNVMLWLYGATWHLNTQQLAVSQHSMMFDVRLTADNVSLSNFHIRGGTFPGTGTEFGTSALQGIISWNTGAFSQVGTATYTDISIMDTTVTNYATTAYDIRGGQRIRISNNTFRNCSSYAGYNTINIIMPSGVSAQQPVNDVFVQNNYFDGNGAECIAIGEGSTPTNTFNRGIISGNICHNVGGSWLGTIGSAACIDLEWSTTTTGGGHTMTVQNNLCINDTPGASSWGISAGSSAGNTAIGQISGVLIQNNICVVADGGLQAAGLYDSQISGNLVIQTHIAGSTKAAFAVIGSAPTVVTPTQSSAGTTLDNIVGSQPNVTNGAQISGTNVAPGTYIVSGAGTATWILSLPTTAPVTTAVTAQSMNRNLDISNNIVRCANTLTTGPFAVVFCRDSTVANNKIWIDPGTALVGFAGIGLLLQNCGWMEIEGNRITNAPTVGIEAVNSNDIQVLRNKVYNPSDAGGSATGITLSGLSGGTCRIDGNTIIDNRAVHLMVQGVSLGTLNGVAVELTNNHIRGATASPTNTITLYSLVKNNTTDTSTWPAVTSGATAGASPFTTTAVPYPTVVSIVGGTVTTVQLNRAGSLTRNLASYGGAAANVTTWLAPGDTITVTHTVAPLINVFPMQ